MIPLVDDFLQKLIVKRLKWLKNNPHFIDAIFFMGNRETKDKLKDFLLNKKVRVVIGFPRDSASLPAYVITLAPENEQPVGLGDDMGALDYLGYDLDCSDAETEEKLTRALLDFMSVTYMNTSYRIECWSDNGDLTAYMYTILKWCLLTSRLEMLKLGWVNITLSGQDFEPVPDYMPTFVYRRSLAINLTYENRYFENMDEVEDVTKHPEKYHPDEDGNIVDNTGKIIIPANYAFTFISRYFDNKTKEEYTHRTYKRW